MSKKDGVGDNRQDRDENSSSESLQELVPWWAAPFSRSEKKSRRLKQLTHSTFKIHKKGFPLETTETVNFRRPQKEK